MVSYSTAKAEALHVTAPRGAMRRAERAVYLVAGAALTPLSGVLAARLSLAGWVQDAPILAALALVGIVANASAIRRLYAIAQSTRRAAAPPGEADPDVEGARSALS